jgi:N-acyl amino acid synthase FeeM
MSLVSPPPEPRNRSDRLFELLDQCDYRVITRDEDREAVFRLRYEAYLDEEAIEPNFAGSLSDHYDDLDNTTIFGIFIDGALASTIRVHVGTTEYPDFPAMPSFSEILEPAIDSGKVIVEASRHATSDVFSARFPMLMPYMTIRTTWLAAQYFGADLYIAAVRREHQAFYRRVFDGKVHTEPRPYNQLIKPLALMSCNFPAQRDLVEHRYPIFRSSRFERRMLINQPAVAPTIGDLEPASATLVANGNAAAHPGGLEPMVERHS